MEELDASHRCPPPQDVMQALEAHGWPGNVRELRNAVERALAMAGPDPLTRAHLRLERRDTSGVPPESLAGSEKDTLARALAAHGGNRMRAARTLGIAVTTLRRKMKEYGLE